MSVVRVFKSGRRCCCIEGVYVWGLYWEKGDYGSRGLEDKGK
jgi:hypothetical protein